MTKIFNPKFFSLLKLGIGKKQISTDLLSGIVVGIVALPLGIAFAVASGVSPEKGLITAIVAGFLISFLGGSRIQIGGPTGAFIIIVYGIVEKYGLDGLFISTILAGIILVIFGFLKLGVLLKYFPRPLIVGFTSGIALVIFSTQIKDALGLSIEKVPSGFIDKWGTYFSQISSLNLYAVILTVATILITVFSSKLIRKIPGSFIAIILITIVVQVLDIPVTTIETFFGEIPNNFSFTVPNVTWGDFSQYLVPAFTIAMLGSIESLLSAVVADGMIGGNHRSNTELIAQGIANIVTPFFGGIPATGAIARTATNVKNGGRTPIAGMMHALTLLLITIFLGKWAKLIPMSCLAGILIVISYNMSEWRSFRSILKGSVFDIIVLLSTFLLTVLVDLTVAIEVGIVLSALLFMKRMADIGAKIPEDRDIDLIDDYSLLPKDVSVYEISGPLFFASAKEYTEVFKKTGFNSKVSMIRMRHVPFIDSTGLHNLQDVVHTLKKSDVEIILSGVQEEVFKTLNNSGLVDFISRSNVFDSFKEAIVYSKEIVKN